MYVEFYVCVPQNLKKFTSHLIRLYLLFKNALVELDILYI